MGQWTTVKQLTYEEALIKKKKQQEKAREKAKLKSDSKTPAKAVKKKKSLTVAQLKKKTDVVFSKYVRLRDAQYRGGIWWCQCCTCDRWIPLKEIQNGHFQSRRYLNTRFHEQNCHPQCVKCNMFNQGEQYKYSLFVDRKYGPGTAKKLEQLARINKSFKSWEYEEMIANYTAKIKQFEEKVV